MSIDEYRGASQRSAYSSSFDDAMRKNIPPPKRDFQESDPPKNLQELYDRYDPSIGAGIAIALGSLLIYLMAQVAIKFICKNIKKGLQKTKKFGKYFPEENFPPLHVVQKLAADQGIEIPESLLNKLIASDNAKQLQHQRQQLNDDKRTTTTASTKKSSTVSTLATTLTTMTPKSPEDIFFNKACQSIHSFRETEFLTNKSSNAASQRSITVNIIGATPAITPNPNHKPYYPPCPTYTQIVPVLKNTTTTSINTVHHGGVGVDGDRGDDEYDANYDNVVVTRATIENFPLLLKNDSDFRNNDSNYNVPSSCAKCTLLSNSGNNSTTTEENSYNRCLYHKNMLIKNETIL